MNSKETIINISRDFLESNSTSRLIRWVMVLFLLFCGIPQKTIAAVTNYTDRQIRNIRDQFENSNGDFPRESEKRGRKKKIKKRIFGRIVKYIMDHPRSTLKDVARYLKEEYKLEVSVKTIERELEEYDLSDLYKLVRKREKRTVHVGYAGGWLLAPFIADMVKKTDQAFGGLAGSVEAILTLFFLSVFGIARVFHLEDLSDPGFAILTGRNGDSLIAALFQRKDDLDGIERIALSFGLSIAISPLFGLALNYTPFGIRLSPVLIVLSVFTISLAIAAYARRSMIPEEDRFVVESFGA